MRITPLGDTALIVELGRPVDELTHHRVQAACRLLQSPPMPGVIEIVPAFTTLTVFYDPVALAEAGGPIDSLTTALTQSISSRLRDLPAAVKPQAGATLEIPVCYGGDFGPDLEQVAIRTGLTQEEVVQRHSGAIYLVYLIGFTPGFPYLGGLPESLAVPRRATARTTVAAGSVGIANQQSCIYTMPTPGGWNIIGRTPLALFRWDADPPSLLQPGDKVRFRVISPDEFVSAQQQS
jgi:inhibitor of KinA